MYSLINPPSSLQMLQTSLENYYPAAICRKLLDSYGLCTEQEVDRTYGLITSDVQVRAPIRAFVKTLADAGVPLDRIFRYQSQFPDKMHIQALFSRTRRGKYKLSLS